MIGDGCGIGYYTSLFYQQHKRAAFTKFPIIGLVSTHCADNVVTDSAASATAISTGKKTKRGHLANGYETLLESNQKKGKTLKMMSTKPIISATNASFMMPSVKTSITRLETERIIEMTKNNKKYFRGCMKNLKQCVENLLTHSKPDLLIIEQDDTDNAGHDNNAQYLINCMVKLDKLLYYLLDYQRKHDNTLLIVTADHDTAGVYYNEEGVKFAEKTHTANFVPLFAIGVGSTLFQGFQDNTDLHNKIKYLLSI